MRRAKFGMVIVLVAALGLICLLASVGNCAEPIPALKPVPEGIAEGVRTRLSQEKQKLESELASFLAAAKVFNDKPAEQQTDAEFATLQARRANYVAAAKAFNKEVNSAASQTAVSSSRGHAATKPVVDVEAEWVRLNPWAKGQTLSPDDIRVIKGMLKLAKQLGWTVEEQARLGRALLTLGSDPSTWSDNTQIQRAWREVMARGQDPSLVQEASQGGGLGLPGAGKQTYAQDCTIFALANAAGLPYGVVAARAAELIRQGEWRAASDRANPQKTIEDAGLMGGEVVMLAEAFGQAEVVPSANFAKTLKEGRHVMVNVVPKGGSVFSGHQVVLTKTFQHNGDTWYVMMDSNQGAQRSLFLSSKELNTMLKENGVAFRAEPGRTPSLLREDGRQ